MTDAKNRQDLALSARDAIDRQPPQRLNRALYLLIVGSFLLPFATVRSCAGDEVLSSHTGIEMLGEEAGGLLVAVIFLAVLLFVFSFRRRVLTAIRQGLVSASKALVCAIAVLTTLFATGIMFMFSRVSVQIGFYACVGSWLALHVLSMHAAIRHHIRARSESSEPPPPWGLTVGILVVTATLITGWLSEPNGIGELALGILASVLIGAPVVVMAMLLAVRYRTSRPGPVVSGSRTE
jgi:hypothetical protein